MFMPLNYGEGKDYAFQRLHNEIDRVNKGIFLIIQTDSQFFQWLTRKGNKSEECFVSFSLDGVAETDHFVVRATELSQIWSILCGI